MDASGRKNISLSEVARRLWSLVPLGGSLPEDVWNQRHRFLLGLTWFHGVLIALVGPLLGYSSELSINALFRDGTVAHTVGEGLIVAFFALVACWRGGGRTFQATAVGFGLMSSSAILVHLSGGYIEFHFHFFVMLVFLALYQDWGPYLLAVVYVAIHHGVMGVLWPEEVYNHAAALNAPWTWAGIHAFFVLGASVGSVIAWRFNETTFAQTQRILESAGEGIYGLDLNGRATFVNPAAAKMLGYEIERLIGQPMHNLLHHSKPDGTPYLREDCPIYAAFRDGVIHRVADEVFWRKDGTSFPVDYVSTPVIERGHLTGAVVTFRDISERKQAEEKIQDHLQRITALREIDKALTSTLDLRTVLDVLLEKIDLVLPYSAATVRLFNKESGLLEPLACGNLDEEEWKAEQWRGGRGIPNVVFEKKAPWMVSNVQTDPRVRDREFFRKHGLVSYLGVPLTVKDEVLGVLSFYTKESHKFSKDEVEFLSTLAGQAAIAIHNSQLYEQTKKQAVELERANKGKDEFLSVMSHELRTPINVVMGYGAMIKDRLLGEITEEQERAVDKIMGSSKDLLVMINGILETTKIEAGALQVQNDKVSLGHFLDDLRSTYQLPLDKKLALHWDYPSDLPVIKTDSEKLRHILQNLINNAVKFTPEGVVTVAARTLRQQTIGNGNSEFVKFEVEDTGVGIPQESLPMIFEKFRQIDSSETRVHGGVGLGLYIVKKFTELLGGEIEVQSEPGKGSTFTVTIPYGEYPSHKTFVDVGLK